MSSGFFQHLDGATPLEQEDIDALIPTTITTQGHLNEWEQLNIQAAYTWAFSRKRREILTTDFLCKFHKRMFGDVWRWAGKLRKSDKNIGVHWTGIPVELRNLLDDTIYWLANQTYPIDEIAVRFHHRLVDIHPFPNGNGRHARLLADMILFNGDVERFSWGGGITRSSDDEIRTQYLHALRTADEGDYAPLLKFVRT